MADNAEITVPAASVAAEPQQNRVSLIWTQLTDHGAPLTEIARYLASQHLQLEKPIEAQRLPDGKLRAELKLIYDPAAVSPATIEGTLRGLEDIGRTVGLQVSESAEQERARQRSLPSAPHEVSVAKSNVKREIMPAREWPQTTRELEQFVQPAPAAGQQPAERPTQAEARTEGRAGAVASVGEATRDEVQAPPANALSQQAQDPDTRQLVQAGQLPGAAPATVGKGVPERGGEGVEPGADERQAAPQPAPAPTQGQPSAPERPAPDGTASAAQPVAASQKLPQELPPGAGELRIKWQQQGDAVAPLLEMRAYLAELQEAGVAVGALKFEKDRSGKLTGSFGVSYDPNAPDLTKLEGIIQGLKKVGSGLEVVEAPDQAIARRQKLGHAGQDQALDLAFPVREAFSPKQWDALSAQLSYAPKQALTVPEQAQQAAGVERVKQLSQAQGKSTDQVIQEGKSLLDIDTNGNPVSAFLKNFYAHLNGAPKTRQTLEVDYEKTRQDLQARLGAQAGNAQAGNARVASVGQAAENPGPRQGPAKAGPAATNPQPVPGATAPAPGTPAATPRFTGQELPESKLALFGLTPEMLAGQDQLSRLLAGEKTDLLTMRAGQPGKEPVQFEGKLLLHREGNGSVTLRLDLPRQKLEIPQQIGGQPFTAAQRQRLEAEGTAGLMRGLKDEAGNTYNGYVGVDKLMNKLVVLPENKVELKDTIAGVKLSPEQSHDLREGKPVHLTQMRREDGGRPFDGTAQIHAARAGVEVRPEAYELGQAQAPKAAESRNLETERTERPGQAQLRASRPKL